MGGDATVRITSHPRVWRRRGHSLRVSHVICKGEKALLPSYITPFFFSEALNVQRDVPFGEEALSLCLRAKHCMQRQWDSLAFAYKVTPYVEVWPHLRRSCSRCLLPGTPHPSKKPGGVLTWGVLAPSLPGTLRLTTPGGVLAWSSSPKVSLPNLSNGPLVWGLLAWGLLLA